MDTEDPLHGLGGLSGLRCRRACKPRERTEGGALPLCKSGETEQGGDNCPSGQLPGLMTSTNVMDWGSYGSCDGTKVL